MLMVHHRLENSVSPCLYSSQLLYSDYQMKKNLIALDLIQLVYKQATL